MPIAAVGVAETGPGAESELEARGRAGSLERRFGVLLAAIALVGLVARVAYVLLTRNHPIYPDSAAYHFRAQLLAEGRGFISPVAQILPLARPAPDAHVPPAWSVFLAGPTKLGLRSVLSHQLVASVVGAATIVMTGLAGRAAFGRRAGLIAAAIVAVYPNVWLYERELMPEALAMLGVATCIWLAYHFRASPSPRIAIALGATVGALAMTRSEEIAILVLLVAPVIMSARGMGRRRRLVWLGLAGLACVLFVAPWAVYNSGRFDRPVILSTGLGGAMSAANCDATYSGELLGYFKVDFRNGDSGCNANGLKFSRDQSISDGQLRRAAFDYMSAHRSRLPIVIAARLGRTFNVFRPFQQVHLEAARKTSPKVLRSGLFAYWALVPIAVAGGVVARRRSIPIYPLLAFPVVVAIAVALTIGSVRYRAPAEIPLALLAAFAIDALMNRGSGTSSRETRADAEVPELLGAR